MSYEEIYKSKLMTADEAVAAHIKSGDKIWLGGLSVADKVLSCVIEKVKQGALENIDFYGNMTMDDIGLADKDIPADKFRYGVLRSDRGSIGGKRDGSSERD